MSDDSMDVNGGMRSNDDVICGSEMFLGVVCAVVTGILDVIGGRVMVFVQVVMDVDGGNDVNMDMIGGRVMVFVEVVMDVDGGNDVNMDVIGGRIIVQYRSKLTYNGLARVFIQLGTLLARPVFAFSSLKLAQSKPKARVNPKQTQHT